MKVKFLFGPKSGATEHINNQTGATLIAAGLAEEVPLPPRGTSGWLEAMAEQEAQRVAALPKTSAVQWAVKDTLSDQNPVRVMIVKTTVNGILYFDSPPADCPDGIRKLWQQSLDLD